MIEEHMLVVESVEFAYDRHKGQTRKYSNEPYILHPIRVAFIVSSTTNDQATIAAANLHDVVEDTDTELEEIYDVFGKRVGLYVEGVTNKSKLTDGNRATRKEMDRQQIKQSLPPSKTIKLADILDNAPSIIKNDPGFAKVWMNEKNLMLPFLREGHTMLYLRVMQLMQEYFKVGR
ncbi:MAG: HD domain-containing protein [Paenisporosarcina sp.]|nr:HD domain-containing protein [Paenisporosarcina sp.]